ncbi:hypothetical protein MPCS_00399 [Candidatus Megaera polyxenophila]|nr:hypothetical protein MPCS_00399 [Candidatus Megaera polyxenophila]
MQNNVTYKILSVEEREVWPLEEVKNYLRVPHKNDDKLIANLISSAVITAEQFLALSFCIKKVTCLIDKAPSYLRLKHIPVASITKVFLLNGEDKKDITENFGYLEDNKQKILFNQKYLSQKLEISYEAGLGDKIPQPILQGV